MKKYVTYLKTILFLITVLMVYSFTGARNENRTVKDVRIYFNKEDNLFLTHQSVNKLLVQNGKYVKKQSKLLINLMNLENAVQKHPMISKSEVSLSILGDLEVNVSQRKPLARVFKSNMNSVYLDIEGKEMPLSKHYTARVLMVNNKNGFIKNQEVFPLVKKINDDDFLKKNIVSIKKDKQGYWVETRLNQQKVLLGSLNDINKKLKKLKAFYGYAANDKLACSFKTINLQYSNQVVCTK